ncbi:receptor like protein 27-like [Magnolia sinica]|uniref:receptor like protein 27-like n=1 Tax=Magnolia sinica TaxID=86752 RepID=UPI002657EB2D|nr:receptor like protein 27-like [Magnolia sinica]
MSSAIPWGVSSDYIKFTFQSSKKLKLVLELVDCAIGEASRDANCQLDNNNFHGNEIPASYSNMSKLLKFLEYLFLDGNYFLGSIPPSFTALKGLQSLDLSRNNLSGKIPQYLENLYALQYLNLSYNHFDDELPKKRDLWKCQRSFYSWK